MRAALAAFVLFAAPALAAAQEREAKDAVKAKVEGAVAALRAKDLDKAMADWPEKAPGRATCRAILKGVIPPDGVKLEAADLSLYHWDIGPKALKVRVRFAYAWLDRDGKEVGRITLFLNTRFVKAGGWQWDDCSTVLMDAVEAVAAAKTRDEVLRVLRDNDELPRGKLGLALYLEARDALAARRKEAARRLGEALAEVARSSKNAAVEAWADFIAGRILREDGRPSEAADAFARTLRLFRSLKAVEAQLEIYHHLVESLLSAGRTDEALDRAREAVELAASADRPADAARARRNLGVVLRTAGLFAKAAEQYRAAVTVARERKLAALECESLLGLAEVEELVGNGEAAGAAAGAALKLAEALGRKDLQAHAHSGLATCAREDGRFADAFERFRKAADLFRAAGDRAGLFVVELELGNTHAARGQYEQALARYRRAYELAKSDGSVPNMTTAAVNAAAAEGNLGNVGDAFAALHSALRAAGAAKDLPNQATIHYRLGVLCRDTGRREGAEEHWTACLRIAEQTGDREKAVLARVCLGAEFLARGQVENTRKMFTEARRLARATRRPALEVMAAAHLAHLALAEGQIEEAAREVSDLLDRVAKADNPVEERVLRAYLGGLFVMQGKLDEAGAEFAKALASAEAAGDPWVRKNALIGLGDAAAARKRWKEAAAHYRAAVAATERLRWGAREPELQVGLFGRLTSPYVSLAACLVELGDGGAAFGEAERVKARTLAESLQSGRAILSRGMTEGERKAERQLLAALSDRTRRLEELAGRKAGEKVVAAARDRVEVARNELDAFRRQVYLTRPELRTARAEYEPASLAELGTSLFRDRPGLVVLSYLVGPEQTLIFVLRAPGGAGGPARLTVHKVAVKEADLAKLVAEFVRGCSDPGGAPDSRNLIRLLLDPAGKAAEEARELVIVPDGPLHRVPFPALRFADRKYLVQRCPVSYAPSVTALVKMSAAAGRLRESRDGTTALVVGISDFGDRAARLPGAEPEAEAVGKLLGARPGALLLGKGATKAKVRAAWAGRRFIHLATHGELNEQAPLFSSLLLATDGKDEGRLYARDLLDAELSAELVVLSACRTGAGAVTDGEGVVGMSWGWFVAGAPSLVASLWLADDVSTPELMRAFYAKLLTGATKAEALRGAQLELLKAKETRHPYYWAPFVLIGDAGD